VSALVFLAFLQGGVATLPVIEHARVNPSAEVSFHAMAYPDTVFVGEAVRYDLAVFVSEEARQRLRKNPEFVPPELRSVFGYDVRDPVGTRAVIREGRTYQVHVFRRVLFPVAPGTILVPPARLSYTVPLGPSFFSREETRSLQSERVTIVALPIPSAGRPVSWNGAVAQSLGLSVELPEGVHRVGDPFVMTVRVTGEGNVQLLPRPVLDIAWASLVPTSERVVVDSLASVARGAKEFDWLVTPTTAGKVTLPAIPYAYFDPPAATYRVTRSAARVITIGEGVLATVDTMTQPAVTMRGLPWRATWERPLAPSPGTSPWYWLVVVLIPVPVLVRTWRTRPRPAPVSASPDTELRRLASLPVTASALQHALRRSLEWRLGGVRVPWADASAARRVLRHHGVTRQTADSLLIVLGALDATTYGGAPLTLSAVGQRSVEVYEAVDREARGASSRVSRRTKSHWKARASVVLLCAMTAATPGVARALSQSDAQAAFARGTVAMRDNDPHTAATEFFRAAVRAPNARAAWIDAGTASWMAADTARAVVAWQRALRLDPTDDEVRDRLVLSGTDAGAGKRDIWPVPRRVACVWAVAGRVGGRVATTHNHRERGHSNRRWYDVLRDAPRLSPAHNRGGGRCASGSIARSSGAWCRGWCSAADW
jgi:hypothetical protein